MFSRFYAPAPELASLVQHYMLVHVLYPAADQAVVKPFPPAPEQCLYFYPRGAFRAMFEERDMFRNVPFEKKSTTIRFVTPNVAIASVVTHVGEFFPPDGVNRGFNVNQAADEMGTMVFVKKNDKWLLTSGQNTVVDARAVDPMK